MSADVIYNPFSTALLNVTCSDDQVLKIEDRWTAFEVDEGFESIYFKLDDTKPNYVPALDQQVFKLSLEDVPLPDLDSISSSHSTTSDEGGVAETKSGVVEPSEKEEEEEEGELEDIWRLVDVYSPVQKPHIISWDIFLSENRDDGGPQYVTEAGPSIFDAIFHISKKSQFQDHAQGAHSTPLLQALFELGLGRISEIFAWDDKLKYFYSVHNGLIVSGYSRETLDAMMKDILDMGNKMRSLPVLLDSFTVKHCPAHSIRIAFSSAIQKCLQAIRSWIVSGRASVVSFCQMQDLFYRSEILVDLLLELAMQLNRHESILVSYQVLQILAGRLSLAHPEFELTMLGILSQCAQPLLYELTAQIGLRSFVHLGFEKNEPMDDFDCALLTRSQAGLVNETRQTLSLLAQHSPNHSLLTKKSDIKLEIGNSWSDVEDIQMRAFQYEQSLRDAILFVQAVNAEPNPLESTSLVMTGEEEQFDPFSIDHNSVVSQDLSFSQGYDFLYSTVLEALQAKRLNSSVLYLDVNQALSISVDPILKIQHRLATFSIIQSLFSQNLIQQLNLQHRFLMFGDGIFAMRLSTALFDPNQQSNEGKRFNGLNAGLRLQDREVWPPASSELRLVLMDILSESLVGIRDAVFEDTISFAIRDLPDDELERCREVDSIYALDFLKMHCSPSTRLVEAIITPESQIKYDRVFKHLLRLLRVKSVTQEMLRDHQAYLPHRLGGHGRLLTIQIHHFISVLADFCQNVVVNYTWKTFSTQLEAIEKRLDKCDYHGVVTLAKSLTHLQNLHDSTLDDILHGLFLKRKQDKALKLIESIFGIVLRFSAMLRKSRQNITVDTDIELSARESNRYEDINLIKALHQDFHQLKQKFLGFLDINAGQMPHESHASERTESHTNAEPMGFDTLGNDRDVKETFSLYEQLLLRLDLTGRYQDSIQRSY